MYRYRDIDKGYVNLLNIYSTQFNTPNNLHHHAFYTLNIIQPISEAIMEYGTLKGYSLSQQYCDDMAWGGLMGTSAFLALPQADQERIGSTLLSENFNNNQNISNISPKGTSTCP